MQGHVIPATIPKQTEGDVQEGSSASGVPPVPLDVSSDSELRQDVDASVPHVSVDNVRSAGVESPGSIGTGKIV